MSCTLTWSSKVDNCQKTCFHPCSGFLSNRVWINHRAWYKAKSLYPCGRMSSQWLRTIKWSSMYHLISNQTGFRMWVRKMQGMRTSRKSGASSPSPLWYSLWSKSYMNTTHATSTKEEVPPLRTRRCKCLGPTATTSSSGISLPMTLPALLEITVNLKSSSHKWSPSSMMRSLLSKNIGIR